MAIGIFVATLFVSLGVFALINKKNTLPIPSSKGLTITAIFLGIFALVGGIIFFIDGEIVGGIILMSLLFFIICFFVYNINCIY